MFPVLRHSEGSHTKLGQAETLTREEKLLPLLKWAGVSLQLVNLLNCDVWHNGFS
jgi:hypothetical protein